MGKILDRRRGGAQGRRGVAEGQSGAARRLARRRHDVRRPARPRRGQEEPRLLITSEPRTAAAPVARRSRPDDASAAGASHGRVDHRPQAAARPGHEGRSSSCCKVNAAGFFDAITDGLDLHDRGHHRILLLIVPPLAAHRRSSRCSPSGCSGPGSSPLFIVLAFLADHQSRLLASDGGDDRAGRLGDARQRPHRRAGRHRRGAPALALLRAAARPRPDADAADLRLPHPDARLLRPRRRAGPDLDRDLRHPRADPAHPSRHLLGAGAAEGGRRGLRRDQVAAPVEGRDALRAADHHGRRHAVHHAAACRWW